MSAVTRERHRRERSTAAMAAFLHWLARPSARGGGSISGERRLTRAGRTAAGTAWQSGGSAAAAGGPATACSPAGQRWQIGKPEAAGSARQSRTAVRRQQTRRERGTDRWTAVPAVPP